MTNPNDNLGNTFLPLDAPAGSHYANALAFIVESVIDGNVEDLTDIVMMDYESMMEFAEQYNFTEEMLKKAIADMRNVVSFLSTE